MPHELFHRGNEQQLLQVSAVLNRISQGLNPATTTTGRISRALDDPIQGALQATILQNVTRRRQEANQQLVPQRLRDIGFQQPGAINALQGLVQRGNQVLGPPNIIQEQPELEPLRPGGNPLQRLQVPQVGAGGAQQVGGIGDVFDRTAQGSLDTPGRSGLVGLSPENVESVTRQIAADNLAQQREIEDANKQKQAIALQRQQFENQKALAELQAELSVQTSEATGETAATVGGERRAQQLQPGRAGQQIATIGETLQRTRESEARTGQIEAETGRFQGIGGREQALIGTLTELSETLFPDTVDPFTGAVTLDNSAKRQEFFASRSQRFVEQGLLNPAFLDSQGIGNDPSGAKIVEAINGQPNMGDKTTRKFIQEAPEGTIIKAGTNFFIVRDGSLVPIRPKQSRGTR